MNEQWVNDFLLGQMDCQKGVEHKDGSDANNRGYAAQYESEQVNEWKERKYELI